MEHFTLLHVLHSPHFSIYIHHYLLTHNCTPNYLLFWPYLKDWMCRRGVTVDDVLLQMGILYDLLYLNCYP